MTEGFTKISHSIWELNLTIDERYMLIFLLDCENKFAKKGDWFSLSDNDFINVGFGKDKAVLRRARKSLIENGLISFRRGRKGNKSQYKLGRVENEKKVKKPVQSKTETPPMDYEGYLEAKAKELLNNMTVSEKRVARWLDKNNISYVPQHPILCFPNIGYIADFYLPSYHSIIEVDGETHNSEEAKEKDALRTKHLESRGYKVFRIDNKYTKDEFIKSKMSEIMVDVTGDWTGDWC